LLAEVLQYVVVLAEDIFDVVATPPCTPASDVVASMDARVDVKLGDGVALLLLE
jgi:hypothetical protein